MLPVTRVSLIVFILCFFSLATLFYLSKSANVDRNEAVFLIKESLYSGKEQRWESSVIAAVFDDATCIVIGKNNKVTKYFLDIETLNSIKNHKDKVFILYSDDRGQVVPNELSNIIQISRESL